MSSVSSRGCSRAFIFCFLWRLGIQLRKRIAADPEVQLVMPLPHAWVNGALVEAKHDCILDVEHGSQLLQIFDGTPFVAESVSHTQANDDIDANL